MNGDFTRLSHRPDKRYAKVLRQQGRVGLEADDNEGTDIQESIATRTTADVVGASGVPVHAAGFRLSQTPDGQDLAISPGRLYLDGLLLEVTATEMVVAVASDKATVTVPLWDVDGQGFKDGQWVEVWNPGGTRSVRKVQALSKAARTIKLATPAGIDATARVLLRRLPTYRTQPDRLRLPAGEPAGAFWLGGGTYAAVLDAFPR
ncbi:MAG TPA: DUF6519 domain-containing protein, partial [Candidatus Thermoplasmatota archaeon]|nr:DUF6519 domain-containing protein [Candidatus Thermoplasmatota archaeon]